MKRYTQATSLTSRPTLDDEILNTKLPPYWIWEVLGEDECILHMGEMQIIYGQRIDRHR